MKASKAIEMLKNYKPDEEIYILWWDSDLSQQFADTDPLTEDEWIDIVNHMEHNDLGSEEISDYLIDQIVEAVSDRES
jgi:hypothetical protein